MDLKAVIEPMNKNKVLAFESLLQDFKIFVKDKVNFRSTSETDSAQSYFIQPRMRMTKGPNKEITLSTSILEAKMLCNTPAIWKSFKAFLIAVEAPEILEYIESISNASSIDHGDAYLGRLTLVPDSLNKHRMVAIVDYWTNLILSPLEEIIRNILRFDFSHTDYLRNHELGAIKVMEYDQKS